MLTYDIKTGLVVKAIREMKGLTQKQIAAILDKGVEAYRRLEKGQIPFTTGQLKIIAEYININLYHILVIVDVSNSETESKFSLFTQFVNQFELLYPKSKTANYLKEEEFNFILLKLRNHFSKQ